MAVEPVIDVSHASARWRRALPDVDRLVVRAARAAVAAAAAGEAYEISVALADDALLHRLNRTYRSQDKPTNVLAFPAADVGCGEVTPRPLGDVVVGFGTAAAESEAAGRALGDHLAHLVAHGVLHLLGFDHESDRDAAAMEALERAALAALGIADPYAEALPRRRAGGGRPR